MSESPALTARTGAHVLVDQLLIQGTKQIFCVPGESYLAVLDALHDASIQVVVCRQEGGASMMAEAQGKLTGRPGICFVTRGPGVSNAMAGIHIAQQDSTPLIVFVGQVARDVMGRDAFQEVDYPAVFGHFAKWAVQIDDAARIPELVARAFHVAMNGRPGPVVVALPEDMLTELARTPDALPSRALEAAPGEAAMAELAERLRAAERPMVLLGGSRWSAQAVHDMTDFATRWQLPVATTFRRQMLFPAGHPCHAGDLGIGANPKLLQRLKAANLILAIGTRLGDIPSQGYTLWGIPLPGQALIHAYPDAEELGRVYQPQLAIHATPASMAGALAKLPAPATPAWTSHTQAAHADLLQWSDPTRITIPGELQMGAVMQHLHEALPADTIMCSGAGNFTTWVHRFWPFTRWASQLAPVSGSMGYGLPAAVGAKSLHPEREVIAFAGDGDFLMHGQEFATAVQYGLTIIVILLDNGMYGTIRMHQERHYPGRVSATQLRNPDFCAYAQAFGGHGERVRRTEEFAPALARARASGQPALIHCLIDPQAITPSTTIDALRRNAQQAGTSRE